MNNNTKKEFARKEKKFFRLEVKRLKNEKKNIKRFLKTALQENNSLVVQKLSLQLFNLNSQLDTTRLFTDF